MPNSVKIKGSFDSQTLRILRSVPEVEAITTQMPPRHGRFDAVIEGPGPGHRVVVEVKRYANPATAHQLANLADHLPKGTHLVLLAEQTTLEARRLLKERGIDFIDGLGNAHIELPGLLIHIEGRSGGSAHGPGLEQPTRLTGKAGIAAQALLLDPERQWSVADLAEVASISGGMAHRVLTRLEREGVITSRGTGPKRTRQVSDRAALLDLWAEEAVERRVRRLRGFRLSRDSRNLAEAVSKALAGDGVDHAITGAAAALRLAPFVTAAPVVDVWVTDRVELTGAAKAAGADPVESGHNISFAQAKGDGPLVFASNRDGVAMVNLFRLYRDLRDDPRRGREQAEHIREEVIGF